MTRYEIATLACKILALWVFVQALLFSENVLFVFGVFVTQLFSSRKADWGQMGGSTILVVQAIALYLIAMAFWFLAPRLAKRMVSMDPAPVTGLGLSKEDVMAVAFSVTGAYLSVDVLGILFRIFVRAAFGSDPFRVLWADVDWQAEFWSAVLRAALAAWLMLGSRGIVQSFRWLRTAGVHAETTTP